VGRALKAYAMLANAAAATAAAAVLPHKKVYWASGPKSKLAIE